MYSNRMAWNLEEEEEEGPSSEGVRQTGIPMQAKQQACVLQFPGGLERRRRVKRETLDDRRKDGKQGAWSSTTTGSSGDSSGLLILYAGTRESVLYFAVYFCVNLFVRMYGVRQIPSI